MDVFWSELTFAATDWGKISALGTWFGATITAVITAVAVILAWRQLRRQVNTARAQIFSDIAREWTELYPTRNSAIGGEITLSDKNTGAREVVNLKTLEELEAAHPTYKDFFCNNREWPEVRKLCNFYEKLGIAVHRGFLEPKLLFVLVTIEDADGRMSNHLKPYIMYLRGGKPKKTRTPYREDIYVFYDYILDQWEKHRHSPLLPYGKNSRRYRFNPPPHHPQSAALGGSPTPST